MLAIFSGCSDETTPGFYSPTSPEGDAPQIESVDPPEEAIAAVTPIVIKGQNFSQDTSQVKVYFNNQYGTIVSGTPTELLVIAPNIEGEVDIRISVNEAVEFSNSYNYNLELAAKDIYPEAGDENNIPVSIVVDEFENIYSSNSSLGIVKIAPDGSSELYSTKAGETFFRSLKLGSDGTLYAARGLRAIFSIPPGGGVKNSPYYVFASNSVKISKIEFDPTGNLWAGGDNDSLFRIDSEESHTSFPFEYEVAAMRSFVENGVTYLYVAAQKDLATTIMRIPILEDGTLGSPEEYFDFSGNYGEEYEVSDIAFAVDGEMILATDMPKPIVYVKPDKSYGLLYSHILLESPALSLAWGTEQYLYYVREEITDESGETAVPQSIVKLNLLKDGAPNYTGN